MKRILDQALRRGAAVPAFNFYNLESLRAIAAAAREIGAPVIFAASESAIKYMGADFAAWAAARYPLHLDHGKSFDACKAAISLGFGGVMIDASRLSFAENVKLTRRVVEYAHRRGVWVEAELGAIGGSEDDIRGRGGEFTDPAGAKKFVELTGCDSLAVAIGTAHGTSKGSGKLRIDILREIRRLLPRTPLVLHGASQIPQKYVKILGLKNAAGIPASEIRRAVAAGINKVNVDSDARLAWTASMKGLFAQKTPDFDPRKYLSKASMEMTELYKREILIISY